MFGPSETGIIRENLVNTDHDKAIELYYEKYSEKHHELVFKNEEIQLLLHQLSTQGYKLGIVTGKARRSLLISLDHLKMNDLFDAIITGDDVIDPKPHPEGLKKALAYLNVDHTDAMFIGDSEADILAGKQANVHTIGVQWLSTYQTLEFSTKPDQIFNRVGDFTKSIQKI